MLLSKNSILIHFIFITKYSQIIQIATITMNLDNTQNIYSHNVLVLALIAGSHKFCTSR
jgi:hypothetical protein